MYSMKNLSALLGEYKSFLLFALVGGLGMLVNTAVLYLLTQSAGINYLLASAIATETAIISNFLGNNFLTFKDHQNDLGIFERFLSFQAISLVSLVGTIFFLWLFVNMFGDRLLLLWNMAAILLMFIANYILNSAYTWKRKDAAYGKGNVRGSRILGVLFAASILMISMMALQANAKPQKGIVPVGISIAGDAAINPVAELNGTDPSQSEVASGNSTYNPSLDDASADNAEEEEPLPDNSTVTSLNSSESADSLGMINESSGLAKANNATASGKATAATDEEPEEEDSSENISAGSSDAEDPDRLASTASASSDLPPVDASAIGDVIAISQLGYHPASVKEAVMYTKSSGGIINIRDGDSNAIRGSFQLHRPKNFAGSNVNCQGNMPCLVADFSDFGTPGKYYMESDGVRSPTFEIGKDVFGATAPLFLEFFNVQLQQGSSYHADMHSGASPQFTIMSDGSFLMEADQAALTLIRLGSAYRRNPGLFAVDKYDIIDDGKPDLQEHIMLYVDYLYGLQGISVQESNAPEAVRLGTGMVINNVFVPGPTELKRLNVYIPNNPPSLLQTAEVVSLCGEDDGTQTWDSCIDYAAEVYKCQIDEPCLKLTYNDKKGILTTDPEKNGYGVSQGWGYEFGCYIDIDMKKGKFNDGEPDPCQVFHTKDSRYYTTAALLGFLQAYPAVKDYSPAEADKLLSRAISTYNHIRVKYPSFAAGNDDAGFYGAAMFLLYDYTGDASYLEKAYNVRSIVSRTIVSDMTRGSEFYWEEYVRHKDDIVATGRQYPYQGTSPEEYFRNKMYHDYKDAGPNSISNNGERVFQFDPNIQFQNSRYMLTEGLLATKAMHLVPNPEDFIAVIAHSQIAWLTGKNLVQTEASLNSPTASVSFIFGIGQFPTEFHSRYLVDTGVTEKSSGKAIGARGTGYQFYDTGSKSYVYFDGASTILGKDFGALGNGWRNETKAPQIVKGTKFTNGLSYIPGWINGAFPIISDGDTIFNYHDSASTYEFTESTNEIVATAIEYYAYLDAHLNDAPGHPYYYVGNGSSPEQQAPEGNLSAPESKEGVPGAKIVSSSTSLKPVVANGSAYYPMREDSKATFSVTSNSINSVTWYVDGMKKNSSVSKSSFFTWEPGILWVPKGPDYDDKALSVVRAETPIQNITWTIHVEDVFNPFFSGKDKKEDVVGSSDTEIRVLSNNKHVKLTGMSATISSSAGSTSYDLSKRSADDHETEWAVYIPRLSTGNNYLTKITGYNNATGETVSFELGSARAHYVSPASGSTAKEPSASFAVKDRTRASSRGKVFDPEVVYAVFGKDVVSMNDSQTITLDAKSFDRGVSKVTAEMLVPDGDALKVTMSLVEGNEYYGTWTGDFISWLPGTYELSSVEMLSTDNRSNKTVGIDGPTFYSANSSIGAGQNLSLVYTLLSQSEVPNGTGVDLILDAQDFSTGIRNVSAYIESNKGDSMTIYLDLVKGDRSYGTWVGSFNVTQPETSYSVKSVTLSNRDDEKTYDLEDRSVYVLPLPYRPEPEENRSNSITGASIMEMISRDNLEEFVKKPVFPTVLGFGLMFIVVSSALMIRKKND
jgi:putative flippase GtrA